MLKALSKFSEYHYDADSGGDTKIVTEEDDYNKTVGSSDDDSKIAAEEEDHPSSDTSSPSTRWQMNSM